MMARRSRITFVSHTSEPGGAELALSRYFNLSTLKFRLVTTQAGGVWEDLSSQNVNVIAPSARVSTFGAIRFLRRTLRSSESDLIVANSMRAAFYCSLVKPKGSKLVYWVRDGLQQSAMSSINLWVTRRFTLRRVDACIANSEWTAATIRGINPSLPLSVVASPAGLSCDDNPTFRENVAANGRVSLLYLGRLSRWKGVHLAISALARLRATDPTRDYRLTVAGGALFSEKSYQTELMEQVEALRLNPFVTFSGHVQDVNRMLRTHDVLLHCSIVPEPFGQVVVQAMGQGTPVVATDAGGPKEIITSGVDGLLYPPGDTEALVDAVQEILDKNLMSKLSRAAFASSRAYTDEHVVSELDKVLTDLADRG